MTQRFFVSPDSIREREIIFSDAQARQIRVVLRMRPGQEIVVLDNAGNEYRAMLSEITRTRVRGEIVAAYTARGEPKTQIILYQALLKADKFEWALQKGTEIGIVEFVPLVTTRAIADRAGKQKFARWTQIVTEAAEQARRGKMPLLGTLQTLAEALARARRCGGVLLVPWELESAHDLRHALNESDAETVHLFIGPEGGFTEQEIEMAHAHGAQSITLGPRILRAETAGLVAASAILYARGDLGSP